MSGGAWSGGLDARCSLRATRYFASEVEGILEEGGKLELVAGERADGGRRGGSAAGIDGLVSITY